MPPPILIVKTGTVVPDVAERRGDFEDLFAEGMGVGRDALRVVNVHRDEALPPPDAPDAVVVTGSAAMASGHDAWSDRTATWLAEATRAGTPILAVCYGHQLLAMGHGGAVGKNPRGREIGTIEVRPTPEAADDPLFANLPAPLRMQATHLESVLALPAAAVRLAGNAADPHQAFRMGDRAWGVQFHPELDSDIIRAYIARRREALAREGLDPDALMATAADSDHGRRLLRRFAELALGDLS